ncbi:polysaccharide biosynthesis/export family protein [Tsuneonella amylolytica]|uniref:polysaccharide biosynthesis/export family protein n=1 Tax=Tsuneonella amylolytica TaxID=2338327 RepID=UPI001F2A2C2E|nr:polysaccharide biosynthesis/export family protein [Tsuneonella amylolytica]
MIRNFTLASIVILASVGSAAVAQAPLPQMAPAPGVVRQDPYRINAGDELQIYVWGEERLQRAVKVLPDGSIAFPLVGQITAQGLLPRELEQAITNGLAGQYRGQVPQVTVSVAAPTGLQFSIMGRVKAPGTFTPGRYVNVLEGLSMAGGPNEFANLNDIVILRKEGNSIRAIPVRVGALFKTGASSNDVDRSSVIRIESGDTVIVP